MIGFHERQSSALRHLSPLLMALKALVHHLKELKDQFIAHKEGLKTLCLIVSQGYGRKEFKNTCTAGLILMCELETVLDSKSKQPADAKLSIFQDVIDERLGELKSQYEEMENDGRGNKIKLHESMNRFQSWIEEFKQNVQLYRQYCKIAQVQIEFNIGYDSPEVVAGYKSLIQLFQGNDVVESFIVSDDGAIERYILSGLQNPDRQIKLYSCRCLQSLLKVSKNGKSSIYNQRAQEIIVKNYGVHVLKSCVIDQSVEIRKASLDILS